jgi:Zn-dependent protease with chaperone function
VLARALLLAAFAATCVPAALGLAAARWPSRSPAAAIVLWQAIGLGWGLAAVGALAGLGSAGSRSGVAEDALALAGTVLEGRDPRVSGLRLLALAAGLVLLLVLCLILVASSTEVLRARRRQRLLLSLLAHGDPKVPGALVVDYPAAAAYCVPGLKSKIVISAGALDLLDSAELAAVLAHERAHLRERHDLVLLPFTALLLAFRWTGVAREANAAVGLLVEMLADDRALRHRPARELATALLRVGAAGGVHAPAGALAVSGGQVAARVSRLLRPAPRLSVPALALVGLAAIATIALPVAFLALPY